MVQYSNLRARVPHLYAMIEELQQALRAPDILEGRKLYDTLLRYSEDFIEQEMAHVAETLEEHEEHYYAAERALNAIAMQVAEVQQHGASPESDDWKQDTLEMVRRRLDRFMETRPAPPVNGGKRRKTRKGKSRRSGRSRYSRRR